MVTNEVKTLSSAPYIARLVHLRRQAVRSAKRRRHFRAARLVVASKGCAGGLILGVESAYFFYIGRDLGGDPLIFAVAFLLGAGAIAICGLGFRSLFPAPRSLLRTMRRYRIERQLLAHQFVSCGACGFPLFDVPPADDGCVVCPECGAAWQIGAIPATPSSPAE